MVAYAQHLLCALPTLEKKSSKVKSSEGYRQVIIPPELIHSCGNYPFNNSVTFFWGPLSLVSTTEELLDRKVAAPA
jgi:hypothetical protein